MMLKSRLFPAFALLATLAAFACSNGDTRVPGTKAVLDLSGTGGFFDTPFPFDLRRHPDGNPILCDFPNPKGNGLVSAYVSATKGGLDGFGIQSGVFLRFDGPIDPGTLPADAAWSLAAGSSVFLVDIDATSPDRGHRVPVETAFLDEAGTYNPPNLLAALPVQGFPLRSGTRYALVVTKDVLDPEGRPLVTQDYLEAFAAGNVPDCPLCAEAFDLYGELFDWLETEGLRAGTVAAATVFTTGSPAEPMFRIRDFLASMPPPEIVEPFIATDTYEHFTVLEGGVMLPLLQDGEPPYPFSGGEILFDAAGDPIIQCEVMSRVALAIPHGDMPEGGWPIVVYFHGGGGIHRQVIDRGRKEEAGTPAPPGTGPALIAANRGWASIGWDGPLCGARGTGNGSIDEILFFNVFNPMSFRDNIRQAAAEATLIIHLLESLTLDPSLVPGCSVGEGPIVFDAGEIVTMGQSTGSTVSPLFLAADDRPVAGILSGAGGSWILNIEQKHSPLEMRQFVSFLVGVPQCEIDRFNPLVSLLQMHMDASDPPSYGRYIIREPRGDAAGKDIYMTLGIYDGYFPPDLAHALSNAIGLDLMTPVIDPVSQTAVELAGGEVLDGPVTCNIDESSGPATGVFTQFAADGVLDGHHVCFQLDAPKHQYGCFLATRGQGDCPTVPLAVEDWQAPCLP